MILEEGDLDLQRNREHIKSVKNGIVSLEEVKKWLSDREKTIEKAYENTKLPENPDEQEIKNLLLKCLEIHYGDLSKAVRIVGKEETLLRQIKEIVKDY